MALEGITLLAFIARYILGLLFFFSGLLKLRDVEGFYEIFLQYRILSGKAAKFGVFILIAGELAIGGMLLLEFFPKIVSGIAFIFLLSSTHALIHSSSNGKKIENCGCFGTTILIPLNVNRIIENVVFLVLAGYLFGFYFFI